LALISLRNVSLDYPIYGFRSDSIKLTLLNKLSTWTTGRAYFPSGEVKIVRALHNISFELNDGDRLGVVGSNGSGKTTLLYMLNRSLLPSSGMLTVDGSVGSMLNLNCGIDPNSSGRENLLFRLKISRVSRKLWKSIEDDIVEFADLGHFIDMPLRIYSSGMMARLLFAMATAINRDILLMDEWLSVGDIDFSRKASGRIISFTRESSILVLASHDTEMVRRVCNKCLRLDHGSQIMFGDTADVLR